jgi:hypothetical protein
VEWRADSGAIINFLLVSKEQDIPNLIATGGEVIPHKVGIGEFVEIIPIVFAFKKHKLLCDLSVS